MGYWSLNLRFLLSQILIAFVILSVPLLFLSTGQAEAIFGKVMAEFRDFRDITITNNNPTEIYHIYLRSDQQFSEVHLAAGWNETPIVQDSEMVGNSKIHYFYKTTLVTDNAPIKEGDTAKFAISTDSKYFLPFRWKATDKDDNQIDWGTVSKSLPPVDCSQVSTSSALKIPPWVKNGAGWWAKGQISDDEFVKGIQYLMDNGVIDVGTVTPENGPTSSVIPQWVKNNAGWWSSGQIDDATFVVGLQYMVSNGIVKVSHKPTAVEMISGKDLEIRVTHDASTGAGQTIIKALDNCRSVSDVVLVIAPQGDFSKAYNGATDNNGQYIIPVSFASDDYGAMILHVEASKPGYTSYIRDFIIDKHTGNVIDTPDSFSRQ